MEDNKKYKILIVDDDKFLLDMYAIKFRESGFVVDLAFGSMSVLRKLQDGAKFDIILMDLVMPTMDGFELLEKIKKDKLANGTKMVILSNLGQKSDIEKGKKLGADGYIVKANTTPSEVVAKVKEIME
jgi:CheY-like chemotaxis protein